MLFTSLLTVGAFAASAVGSPVASTHAVHEKRDVIPDGWSKRDALDRRAILPMRIGLAQGNLDKGSEWLNEVSHPDSEKYGQHWSAADVANAFKPTDKTVDAVKSWLASAGISADRVKQSQSLAWIEFQATVDEAEGLLNAKYHVYEHESGQPHVACEEYSLPASVKEHVDFVYPTVHFDAKLKARELDADIEKRQAAPARWKGPGYPSNPSNPKGGWGVGKHHGHKLQANLSMCDE